MKNFRIGKQNAKAYKLAIVALFVGLSAPAFAQAGSSKINFNANFDSGAIGKVELMQKKNIISAHGDSIEHYRYNITTQKDAPNPANPDLAPSNRWFYFLMSGVKGKEIALDIDYNDSKRPVYSYNNVDFERFSADEVPVECKTITKTYTQDSVYIAYYVPYNVEHNYKRIEDWSASKNVQKFSIGESQEGRDLTMMVISNNLHSGLIPNAEGKLKYTSKDKKKKIIYIHGRIHPSETPASWQLDGIIDILAGNSQYAEDLRDNAIFYVLPFTNPDGVYGGMSRANPNGVNLEVNYNATADKTAKEVKNITNFLMSFYNSKLTPSLSLNMHSQIAPHITYWVHNAESTSFKYFSNVMLLANLTIYNNPYFGKKDLSFSKVAPKYVEGWLYNRYKGKTLATTFETPYTYYQSDSTGVWVTPENLKEQGINTVNAVNDLFALSKEARVVVNEPKRAAGTKAQKDNEHFYFGKSYLKSTEAGAMVKYKGELPTGKYDVYMWSVGAAENVSAEGKSEWVKIGEFTQNKSGKFRYNYISKKSGEMIDRALFVKKEL